MKASLRDLNRLTVQRQHGGLSVSSPELLTTNMLFISRRKKIKTFTLFVVLTQRCSVTDLWGSIGRTIHRVSRIVSSCEGCSEGQTVKTWDRTEPGL